MGEIARRVTAMEAPRVAVQRQVFGVPAPTLPRPAAAAASRPVASRPVAVGSGWAQDAPLAGIRGLLGARPVRAAVGLTCGAVPAWGLVSLVPDGLLVAVPVTGLGVFGALLLLGRRAAARRNTRIDAVLTEQLRRERQAVQLEQARERGPVRVDVEVDEVVVDAEVVEPVALPARAAVEVPAVVRRRVVA